MDKLMNYFFTIFFKKSTPQWTHRNFVPGCQESTKLTKRSTSFHKTSMRTIERNDRLILKHFMHINWWEEMRKILIKLSNTDKLEVTACRFGFHDLRAPFLVEVSNFPAHWTVLAVRFVSLAAYSRKLLATAMFKRVQSHSLVPLHRLLYLHVLLNAFLWV